MNAFKEINGSGQFSDLNINKDDILEKIGLGRIVDGIFEYLDLSNTHEYELFDLLIKTVRYEEYVNEVTAVAEKRKKDMEVNINELENRLMSAIVKTGVKATEAKSIVKSDHQLIELNKKFNEADVYVTYLKNFVSTLDKYHYVIKARIQALQNHNRKPVQ